VEQWRFDDGADGGELAELRTAAAAPQCTVGPDGFRASSIASDFSCRWTFSSEDVAGSRVVGRGYRDSVSLVVENEAQSYPRFSRGDAYSADRLGLSAEWVSLRPRSDVVLVGWKQSRGMGWFGLRHCGRLAVLVLVFLRQESGRRAAIGVKAYQWIHVHNVIGSIHEVVRTIFEDKLPVLK